MNAAMLTTIRPIGVAAPMAGIVQRRTPATKPRLRVRSSSFWRARLDMV